jgi:tRNA pseudouridine55 synthase
MAESSSEGVLPIDKPAGPTSHDIVARARRALGIRRIGHTGTLDPFASGLLLLCIGRTTRLAEYLTGLPKTYAATLRLGGTTDTDDITGAMTAETDAWRELPPDSIEAALLELRGTYDQLPPAYSARKVGGERAYRLARAGVTPDLSRAEVHVYDLEVTRVAPPDVDFTVRCSAGTYIRSIARDAGARLAVGAYLTALRRTAIGEFTVELAVPADALEDAAARDAARVRPLDALAHLPQLDVAEAEAAALRHGRTIPAPPGFDGIVVLTHARELLAIGDADGSRIRPRKVFTDE